MTRKPRQPREHVDEKRKRERALAGPSVPAKRGNGEQEQKQHGVREALGVPVALLLAAESITVKADKDGSFPEGAWPGVLIHQKDAGSARVVACDGPRLFVGAFSIGGRPPSWLKVGIMLPKANLKARAMMIGKATTHLVIGHEKGTSFAYISDSANPEVASSLFKTPVDVSPKVVDYDGKFNNRPFEELADDDRRSGEPVGINSRHMRQCGDVARILESSMSKEERDANGMVVRFFEGAGLDEPRMFLFEGYDGAVLVVSPTRFIDPTLSRQTARVLAPVVRGTVAALRAHATRWIQAAEAATTDADRDAARAKADGFQQRVAAVLQQAPDVQVPGVAGPATDASPRDGEPVATPPDPPADKPAGRTRPKTAAGATVH